MKHPEAVSSIDFLPRWSETHPINITIKIYSSNIPVDIMKEYFSGTP